MLWKSHGLSITWNMKTSRKYYQKYTIAFFYAIITNISCSDIVGENHVKKFMQGNDFN